MKRARDFMRTTLGRLDQSFRDFGRTYRRFAADYGGLEVPSEDLRSWRDQLIRRYETEICAGTSFLLEFLTELQSRCRARSRESKE